MYHITWFHYDALLLLPLHFVFSSFLFFLLRNIFGREKWRLSSIYPLSSFDLRIRFLSVTQIWFAHFSLFHGPYLRSEDFMNIKKYYKLRLLIDSYAESSGKWQIRLIRFGTTRVTHFCKNFEENWSTFNFFNLNINVHPNEKNY